MSHYVYANYSIFFLNPESEALVFPNISHKGTEPGQPKVPAKTQDPSSPRPIFNKEGTGLPWGAELPRGGCCEQQNAKRRLLLSGQQESYTLRPSPCCSHMGMPSTLESAPMGLRHSTQVLAQNLSKHFRQQWWPSFCTYFFPCKGSLQ